MPITTPTFGSITKLQQIRLGWLGQPYNIIGSFKFTFGPMVGVWLVVKATVSQRAARTLVEE